MEVRVLGPLEVDVAARRLELRRRKQRALIALLALRAGEVVSTDQLIEGLWGESPPKAALSSLQNLVSELRRLLEPELVVTRPSGYVFELVRDAVDAHRFELLVHEARSATEPNERAKLLRSALSLWRGAPFADLAFEPFALLAAPRLEELSLLASEDLIDAELALGRHTNLLQEVETLVEKHPYDERLRAQLMVILYRCGRQADALEAYRQTRRFLIAELGIEPSAQLRDVELAILRQDPALAPRAPLRTTLPVRRTVSVLFADLVDSTVLGEQLDPEALRALYDRIYAEMREVLERHGGTVEKFIGDAVLAVFGVPQAHEDDAHRALRAAWELRDRLGSVSRELEGERGFDLRLRIGVNTGEVFVGHTETADVIATGAAVNVAKRLEEAAPPNEIVLGAATLQLVRDAVDVEPLEPLWLREGAALGAWRLARIASDAPAITRRLSGALIGRLKDLSRLHVALEQARRERRCRLVVVAGEPGIGKTRLVHEFVREVDTEATVLLGGCVSYGGVTWLPLIDMLGQLRDHSMRRIRTEPGQLDPKRVQELIEQREGQGSRDEVFRIVRELFETEARERPLVAIFDDVHWAESTLLDLIEYLGARSRGAPLLLVAVTRPELFDLRPQLAVDAILLDRLTGDEADALVDSLDVRLTVEMRTRVVGVAGGNPLFVEQLVAHAREHQELAAERLEAVPPSVEALLASRIDLLAPDERAVLQRASIIGTEFHRDALGALTSDTGISVDAHLRTLGTKGFIRTSVPEDRLAFHHALVRDVAYAELPKADRAALHERLADWLEAATAGQASELEEIVGYHLEQASHYRRALLPRDAHALAVGRRAASLLASAARRAPARGDWPAAAALLDRAVALLPQDDLDRLRLLPDLARAIGRTGDYERELTLLDEAAQRAAAVGDARTRAYAQVFRGHARAHIDPAYTADQAAADATEALRTFEEIGDARGQARAWASFAHSRWFCGRHEEARAAEQRTLAYALAAGDQALQAEAHGLIGGTLLDGPAPLDRLISYAEALEGKPGAANLMTLVARARAMKGDFETARDLVADDVAAFMEVGNDYAAARAAAEGLGAIEMLAGDPVEAERHLRRSFRALEHVGETGHLSTVAAQLANALYAQDRWQDAEEFSRISEEAAAPDDYLSQILWRLARARVLAKLGRPGEGERLARAAVDIAARTDDINRQGDALSALAEVLLVAGRLDEAVSPTRKAVRLYEEKGNIVAAGRAGRLLAPAAGR
ncbi:MAG TPA: BTAD domain-containing putative transcriptional regulator [Gaiellaceae bacterium]|nr:BTAD domain-containing putative transcriptional regulator [Gaiellaceae bacterium]